MYRFSRGDFQTKVFTVHPDFFLFFLLVVKRQEEKDKLRKEQLSKKQPAIGDLRGSQPIQIAKNVKLENSLLESVLQRQSKECGWTTLH